MNFHVGDPLAQNPRTLAYNYFKNKPFVFMDARVSYERYLSNMSKFVFVLSPPGVGYDCYRHWESLLVGCYPIMFETPLHKDLFSDLPVIIVDSWKNVTTHFLKTKYQEFKNRTWNMEKLYANYWIAPILEEQAKLRAAGKK